MGADEGQDRSKDLLLGNSSARADVGEDGGGDEVALAIQLFAAQHQFAFAFADRDVIEHLALGARVDQRADLSVRLDRVADAQRPRTLDHLRQDWLVDRVHNDRAGAGRAFLALVAEGAGHDPIGCRFEVGRLVHHDPVLAAHLELNPLQPDLPRLDFGSPLVDSHPHVARAGEGDEADPWVLHQRVADGAAGPGQVVDDAVGKAQLAKEIDQPGRGGRRGAGGFEHHRVAGHDGGRQHARREREREVPGRDDSPDSERDVVESVLFALQRGQIFGLPQPQHLARVPLHQVDRLGGLAVGLVPGLAHFEHHQRAHFVPTLANQLGRAKEELSAQLGRRRCPGWERALCGLHGRVHVLHTGHDVRSNYLVGMGRVDRVERLSVGDWLPADPERLASSELAADTRQRRAKGGLGGRIGEVGHRLVAEGRNARRARHGNASSCCRCYFSLASRSGHLA